MRKTTRLQSAQALALAAVCAVEVSAAGLVQAQAPAPVPPPPAQAPAQPPAVPTPPPSAAAPAAPPVQPGVADPAAPVPGSTTEVVPPAEAGAPQLPAAAEPTSPPAYVEPMQPVEAPPAIEAAPTPAIDEQLALEPRSKVPSYVMWAVGGASLITGAVLGVSALTAKSDFDDNPTYEGADKVEGRAVAADVALGLSAVLLVTGTIFYFLPDAQAPRPTAQNTHRPTARWQVTPMLGRTNGGALSVQF